MITNYDVTIGIPVFNVERYIEKSLLSALEQETYLATLKEVFNFKHYKFANHAFYSLSILPNWMTLGIILLIAKYKQLL